MVVVVGGRVERYDYGEDDNLVDRGFLQPQLVSVGVKNPFTKSVRP